MDLEKSITLLHDEKIALEKAKQELAFEVDELKGQMKPKDQQLDELKNQLFELERA